jgi:hypothetical protein
MLVMMTVVKWAGGSDGVCDRQRLVFHQGDPSTPSTVDLPILQKVTIF